MGFCACKDDGALWEKRSKRDALSIEIAALHLRAAPSAFYLRSAWVLLLIRNYLRNFTIASCVACCNWTQCAPVLHERFSELHETMRQMRDALSKSAPATRIPFIYSIMMQSQTRTLEILSERLEDLSFVKDEKTRAALDTLAELCKEAGPKLDDWRKSMDFLH